MRVLLIHNFYKSRLIGGEDIVVKNEEALLRKHGYDVITYFKNNDDVDSVIKLFHTAVRMRHNQDVYNEVVKLCKRVLI
jgi:hypothetical protein